MDNMPRSWSSLCDPRVRRWYGVIVERRPNRGQPAALPDPELAQQGTPLRVVLVVAHPGGDQGHIGPVERRNDGSLREDRILDALPKPDGLRRVVHLGRGGALHPRVDRAVAEPGEVKRGLRRRGDVGRAAEQGAYEALGGRKVGPPPAEADLRPCPRVRDLG